MDIFHTFPSNQYAALALGVKHVSQPRPSATHSHSGSSRSKPSKIIRSSSLFKRTKGTDTSKDMELAFGNPSQEDIITFGDVADRHRLLRTGDFSDCMVIACGKTFKLHKAVICYQSQFFWKALTCGMREGLSGVVELPEEKELDDVSRMIKFLYEGVYRDPPSTQLKIQAAMDHLTHIAAGDSSSTALLPFDPIQAGIDDLWLDIRMYSLGDRYMIEGLQKAALASFCHGLNGDFLFPVTVSTVNPEGALRFLMNEIDTVPTIIDLSRRIWLEGDDLSQAHKDAIFSLCFKLYPCLMKFPAWRAALTGELSPMAAKILVNATGDRTERMVERCCGCEAYLMQEAAMELTTWCHSCRRTRKMEDLRIECAPGPPRIGDDQGAIQS